MKVLFIHHSTGFGGATKSLILMQQALKSYAEIYTVIPNSSTNAENKRNLFSNSKEVIELNIPTIYSYSEKTIKFKEFKKRINYYPTELINYINENLIDIVHINSSLYSNILRHIKKNTKSKIVSHIREMLPFGYDHPIDRFIIENYSQFSDAIIAISPNEVQFFSMKHNVFIIPNPHDFNLTNAILEDKSLNQLAYHNSKFTIGMIANFLPIKGHLIFLEACKIIENQLKNSNLKTEYFILGYPSKKISLKGILSYYFLDRYKIKFDKKVKRLKLRNLKILEHSYDIYNLLSAVDIYVRPDISGHPWGRDVIEAMAFKKPIIATGESEFFIENGVTGYLVTPKEPKEIAKIVIELLKNPEKRKIMGEIAYQKIRNMCDIKEYGDKLISIYNRI